MTAELETIKREYTLKITAATSTQEIEALAYNLQAKKNGVFTNLFRHLASLPDTARAQQGAELNTLKRELQQQLTAKTNQLKQNQQASSWLDITLPTDYVLPNQYERGSLHPLTQTIREISQIFKQLGFLRRRYRETETDFYAFEGLNMPVDHPARAEWETWYLKSGFVVTPHTSSGQLREMARGALPIRMINISRCGRPQEDVTHIPTLNQFEGLLVDKKTSLTELKGVLTYFVHSFFGPESKIRLRPYNFRFTEPSFEIDISCQVCGGQGCRVCKSGWLELGGAGMVHPQVLTNAKINPTEYKGFAFGWGVERVYMMKAGITDIRTLYENELRFLKAT